MRYEKLIERTKAQWGQLNAIQIHEAHTHTRHEKKKTKVNMEEQQAFNEITRNWTVESNHHRFSLYSSNLA